MSTGFERYVRNHYPLTSSYLDATRTIEYTSVPEILTYLRTSLNLICDVRSDSVLKASERKLKDV